MVWFLAQYFIFFFQIFLLHLTFFPLFFITQKRYVIQTCMSKVKIKIQKEEWKLKIYLNNCILLRKKFSRGFIFANWLPVEFSRGFIFTNLSFINVLYTLIFSWFILQLVVCEWRNSYPNFLIFQVKYFWYDHR